MGYSNTFDTNLQFQYNSSTLQIHHPTSGHCLDDGGNHFSAELFFTTCDSASINQQFIFTTDNQILNPNWPKNPLCFDGSGNAVYGNEGLIGSGFYFPQPALILSPCDTSVKSQIFHIFLICPPGALFCRYVDGPSTDSSLT